MIHLRVAIAILSVTKTELLSEGLHQSLLIWIGAEHLLITPEARVRFHVSAQDMLLYHYGSSYKSQKIFHWKSGDSDFFLF